MASGVKQIERVKSTEDLNFKMRRSFSWDRAFFTNEGFLNAEELSNMIDGDGNDVNHQLEKIDEIESLEAKLFEEMEASKLKINLLSEKRDSQLKKLTAPVAPRRAAPPTKPAPSSVGFGANNVKSSSTVAKRNTKTGKIATDSPSKTPPGNTTKNKVSLVNTRLPKTSPSSPVSPGSSGSSSSTSAVNQRSKRGSSVPRRSVVNSEKPTSTINSRKKDDQKTGKPTGVLILNTPPIISLKSKPPPVSSHPSSPLGLSSSSTGLPKTGSPNGPTKGRKLPATKTVAASNTGSKTSSQKTTMTAKPSKKQASGKGKPSTKNIFVMSPEIMDLKGKLNALKMEISMHKKDKESKNVSAES